MTRETLFEVRQQLVPQRHLAAVGQRVATEGLVGLVEGYEPVAAVGLLHPLHPLHGVGQHGFYSLYQQLVLALLVVGEDGVSLGEAVVVVDEEDDEVAVLSLKKVSCAQAWQMLTDLKSTGETTSAKVLSSVKGGLIAEIEGLRGFIPSSQLRVKETDLEPGSKIEVKILTLDAQQNNFILSNKKVYEDNAEETRKNVFSQLEVGQVVKGEVVRITDFGAFIDIGGIDGLLPLSQLSWRWIDHPTDILSVGSKIDVEVILVDNDKQRVSLSLKNLEPDPWIAAEKNIKEGDKIQGTVTRIKYFGAFVEVYPGVEALLPHNEVVEYQNETKAILQVGDKIDTFIIKFNPSDRRIALSVHEHPETVQEAPNDKKASEDGQME